MLEAGFRAGGSREATSKSIDGITDLVVIAPIKPGMISAFENVTYETRLKLTAEALHKIRVNAREHELVAPFADTAERILMLSNFRIGVLDPRMVELGGAQADEPEPRRLMFLVATFDGPWEPYMRLIWKPLGPFLDLLLCNCEDPPQGGRAAEPYPLATQTGFAQYADWVRRHQVEPSIFYSTTGLTVRDQIYLAQLEKLQRECDPASADARIAATTMRDPEDKARDAWSNPRDAHEAIRLSFEALAVLGRLADYYPPDRPDGRILERAVRDLLLKLPDRLDEAQALGCPQIGAMIEGYGLKDKYGPYTEVWRWYLGQQAPAPGPTAPRPPPPAGEVQKGLLTGYDSEELRVSHGAVVMLSIEDPALAAQAFRTVLAPDWEGEPGARSWPACPDGAALFRNLAFTASGLRQMGMAEEDVACFPKEFRDGLYNRAPLLGDVREHHPRRWQWPPRFDPLTGGDDTRRPPIHAEEVDCILQLRLAMPTEASLGAEFVDLDAQAHALERSLAATGRKAGFHQSQGDALKGAMKSRHAAAPAAEPGAHPLSVAILALARAAEHTGLRVVAVESAFRPSDPAVTDPRVVRDHFGFVDGLSQPLPADAPGDGGTGDYDDRVPYGDIVIGHANSRGDPAGGHLWPGHRWAGKTDYLVNGSFLALRKIAQYPDRFKALVAANPAVANVAARIVGRREDGTPLIGPATPGANVFRYDRDVDQAQCPFSSHIRLANPRDIFQGRPAPRILRRGMSYGPRFDPGDAQGATQSRGILFMAYGSNLAEQYEVIQRWLNGGNPTHVASAAHDPLTGVAKVPGPHTFRFVDGGQVRRVTLPQRLSQLRWGLYAFAPGKAALEALCRLPGTRPDTSAARAEGERLLAELAALSPAAQKRELKRLLEDVLVKDPAQLNAAPRIWRAIREKAHNPGIQRFPHGMAWDSAAPLGVTPDGSNDKELVLVGSWELIREALSRPQDFSVAEQGRRAALSFGEIFVAMDPDPKDTPGKPLSRYARESRATNEIVFAFSNEQREAIFQTAHKLATDQLNRARGFSAQSGFPDFYKIELRRDFITPVLAGLCRWLWDVPDADPGAAGYIESGAWGWAPPDPSGSPSPTPPLRRPRCPADFMAPSRMSFYPRPTNAIWQYGRAHGAGLNASAQALIRQLRQRGFRGQISSRLAAAISDDELLARNIIGNMEGMLPPTDGIVRGIFFDWIDLDDMWRHQSQYLAQKGDAPATLAVAERALDHAVKSAMCKRPAPDLIYRTATRPTTLGGEAIKPGDTLILGLVSPMLASLDDDAPDVAPVFGGIRKKPWQDRGEPTHACPAYNMVMAMVHGMIAALFEAGRIVVQPASMILRISDWEGAPPSLPPDGFC